MSNTQPIKIGYIKTFAEKGDRVTVYFDNGTSNSFIAQNDLTASKVAVIGDRVFSEDVSRLILNRTTELFKTTVESSPDLVPTWAYLFETIDRKDLSLEYAYPTYCFDGFRNGAHKIGDGSTSYPTHTEAKIAYLSSRLVLNYPSMRGTIRDRRGSYGRRFKVLVYDANYVADRDRDINNYTKPNNSPIIETELDRIPGKRSVYCQIGSQNPKLILEIPYDEPFSTHISYLPNKKFIEVVVRYGKLPQRPYFQSKGIWVRYYKSEVPANLKIPRLYGGSANDLRATAAFDVSADPSYGLGGKSNTDYPTKEWVKVKVMKFKLNGSLIGEKVYTNPEPIEIDPDNWQKEWLSTYSDYRGTPDEWEMTQDIIDWLNQNGSPKNALSDFVPYKTDEFSYNLFQTPLYANNQEAYRLSFRTGLITDKLSGWRTAYCDRALEVYDLVSVPQELENTQGLALLTIQFGGFGGMTSKGFVFVEPEDLESSEDPRYYGNLNTSLKKVFPGLSKNIIKGLSKRTVQRARSFLTTSELTQTNLNGIVLEQKAQFPKLQIPPEVLESDYNFLALTPIG